METPVLTRESVIVCIKHLLIERLQVAASPEAIADDAVLFHAPSGPQSGEVLGLDSVEVLEILAGLKSRFKLSYPRDLNPEQFSTIGRMADLVLSLEARVTL